VLSRNTRTVLAWAICLLGGYVVVTEIPYWSRESELAPVLTALGIAVVLVGVLVLSDIAVEAEAEKPPTPFRPCRRPSCGHPRARHAHGTSGRLQCQDCTCTDFLERPVKQP
jgi:hypothetical protein